MRPTPSSPNAAIDKTSGIDCSAHYRFGTGRFGKFDFNVSITDVLAHSIQEFEGKAGTKEPND